MKRHQLYKQRFKWEDGKKIKGEDILVYESDRFNQINEKVEKLILEKGIAAPTDNDIYLYKIYKDGTQVELIPIKI